MSRFNDHTTFMVEALDYWYQCLPYHTLQNLYGVESVTRDIQQSWYKLSYNKKNNIYEGIVCKDEEQR